MDQITMTVRPAKPSDREAIAAIQAASPEASAWDPKGFECYVVTVEEESCLEGKVVGFIVTRATAPGEFEILNLAVSPAHRRQGVARALVNHVVKARPGAWFLEVRGSNRAAIRLYESEGFQRAGIRENYYNNPSEPAIVMRFQS